MHFRRWKQKMLFFLTMRTVTTICTFAKPTLPENPIINEIRNVERWVENDFFCKNFILNTLCSDLYDYYCKLDSAKNIWNAVQKNMIWRNLVPKSRRLVTTWGIRWPTISQWILVAWAAKKLLTRLSLKEWTSLSSFKWQLLLTSSPFPRKISKILQGLRRRKGISYVFRFGCLVMEIISGQKNSIFCIGDKEADLIAYVSNIILCKHDTSTIFQFLFYFIFLVTELETTPLSNIIKLCRHGKIGGNVQL